ncbi:MAG: ATP synthase F0 subunit B [Puniceicoccaceae bacterium]|nr:ATP synthase F0 subunit B [Puniceicoccaceae bacterium]
MITKCISVFAVSCCLFLGLQAADPTMTVTSAEETGRIEAVAGKFGVTWPTLFAQMVNFILVALILYKFAIKPIMLTYDERQKKIADGLQYAEQMKVQSLEAEKERHEKIKEAAIEAQKILSEARDQSKALLEQKVQEATAQAEATIRKAGEATELERQKMLSEVKQEVARLVVETTAKVLDKELSAADKDQYSNAAAENLSKNLS